MPADATPKVLLIGWDAADWRVIDPLMAAGKMPALRRFVEGGVRGRLATLRPILSPMLWTSIATGVRPFDHGICGFTEPDPDTGAVRSVSTASRKVKAIWNILGQNGLRSNVIGWWPSHPAEPINGVMVSNHYQRAPAPAGKPWPLRPGTVHPARLAEPLAKLRVHPQELEAGHLLPFVPRAAEIDTDEDSRLVALARVVADTASVHAAATAVMANEPWDLMAVYYDAIDHFGHGFMKYHPPRRDHVAENDYEMYKGVVEAAYRYHDMMLGALLRLAGPETTVILISDHGFHPDHLRPVQVPIEPAGPAAEHGPYGIIAMRGPNVKRGAHVYGGSLLDIAPTLLTLFGLPVGADMAGKPLVTAFEDPPRFDTIISWERVEGDDGRHPPDARVDPNEARESLRQLIDLGYIEDPGPDRQEAVARTMREWNFNLAHAYLDDNRHRDALPLLETLRHDAPDDLRFARSLAECLRALGETTRLREVIERLLATQDRLREEAQTRLREIAGQRRETGDDQEPKPTQQEARRLLLLRQQAAPNDLARAHLMGLLLLEEGETDAAIEQLRIVQSAQPESALACIQIGRALQRARRWPDARTSFERALEIDPDSAAAHLGLCICRLATREDAAALDHALDAVERLHHNPIAHYHLAVALHRLGELPRATEALKVAISQNPNFARAHRRLAAVYRALGDAATGEEHRATARRLKFEHRARRAAAPTR